MKLTNTFIKSIKPSDRLVKYSDGNWLSLYCYPNGSTLWRVGYRYNNKEKLLSLGKYPEISLKSAREKNAEIRALLERGVDPSEARQDKKRQLAIASENNFEAVAIKWHETWAVGKEPSHVRRVLSRLKSNVFKEIGCNPFPLLPHPCWWLWLRELNLEKTVLLRSPKDLIQLAIKFSGLL